MPKISPKLAAAIAPPLTAVVTHIIITGKVDRASLALLAAILIGAALGYHAPRGDTVAPAAPLLPPMAFGTSNPTVTGSNPGWSSTSSTTPMIVLPSFDDDDPALDDPAHADDEPEIPESALTGRRAGSAKQKDHVNLGDPA